MLIILVGAWGNSEAGRPRVCGAAEARRPGQHQRQPLRVSRRWYKRWMQRHGVGAYDTSPIDQVRASKATAELRDNASFKACFGRRFARV